MTELRVGVFLCALLLVSCSKDGSDPGNLKLQTYQLLDQVRDHKRSQLTSYLQGIRDRTDAWANDPYVRDFFFVLRDYYDRAGEHLASPEMTRVVRDAMSCMDDYYLVHGLLFYDILFIDATGDIFHTIRREGDYHQNLFSEEMDSTSLARHLMQASADAFVDFEHYDISGEPSAFLVKPMGKNGSRAGWLVFQFAINRINRIFSQEKALGITGEAFLVNQRRAMLTDSRFMPESSILNQHLSPENIQAKFQMGKGHKCVLDYRGFQALTSFEVCPVMGICWLLVAKIDVDEVIWAHASQHIEEYSKALWTATRSTASGKPGELPPLEGAISVDMDEFQRAAHGETLFTNGVSTCTAVIIELPSRFAYMAHISPLDAIYGNGETDILGHMLKRIERFDVRPFERRQLQFTLVSPQTDGFVEAIKVLMGEGFFPSQIRVMHHPMATQAMVVHRTKTRQTDVYWKTAKENPGLVHDPAEPSSIGEIILQELMREHRW